MRRPRLTIRSMMVIVAVAAVVIGGEAMRRRRAAHLKKADQWSLRVRQYSILAEYAGKGAAQQRYAARRHEEIAAKHRRPTSFFTFADPLTAAYYDRTAKLHTASARESTERAMRYGVHAIRAERASRSHARAARYPWLGASPDPPDFFD